MLGCGNRKREAPLPPGKVCTLTCYINPSTVKFRTEVRSRIERGTMTLEIIYLDIVFDI